MIDTDRMGLARRVLWLYGILIALFLLAPIVIIVITSFGGSQFMEFPPQSWSLRWYESYFSQRHWIEPTLLSLRVAAVTAVLSTILGTVTAVGIVRGRFRGRKALEFFVVSPMIVPIIVLAIGFYFVFSSLGLIGNPVALYLSHTVLATPLVVVIVTAGLRASDPALDLAARSLGAGFYQTLWFVTLPVVRPSILGGAAFAFLVSFDEVVVAVFVGGPHATTLPKRMWDSIRFEIDPTLTAISSILVFAAVLVLILAELFTRRQTRRRVGSAG